MRTKQAIRFPATELARDSRRLVSVGNKEIVVLDVGGQLYAVRNTCPHQQAPMLAGPVGGARLPSDVGEYLYGMAGQVIRCPWHSYEFDLRNGRCLADPQRYRIATYRVQRDGDDIVVYV